MLYILESDYLYLIGNLFVFILFISKIKVLIKEKILFYKKFNKTRDQILGIVGFLVFLILKNVTFINF